MPIELAMPIYLSNEEYLNPRACLHQCPSNNLSFSSSRDQQQFNGISASLAKPRRAKKRVSFADHKGLALTMVKIFSEFDDPIDIPTNIEQFFSASLTLSERKDMLTLDFDQPSADYLKFRQRIENYHVCLEHCMLKEKSIAGTVKVKNLSFEKSVKLRITFDTWKSHTDINCQYVKDTYTGSNRDTFSFEASLPDQVPPHEHIEFAICYEVNGTMLWDNNQGQNYRIIQSALKKSSNDSSHGYQRYGVTDWDVHFDRLAAPDALREYFPIGQAMLDMKTLVLITKNLLLGQFILYTHPSDIVINTSLKCYFKTLQLAVLWPLVQVLVRL